MIDSQENYKEIEDIIDVRKKLGQYDVYKAAPVNNRYTYSNPATTSDKFIRFDDSTMLANEGDSLNNNSEVKRTDSEITVVRVRCDGMKRRASKWDMHDIAVPGDGSHLGESPSMVNLATLVQQNDEYLVPLSSWDPYYKSDEGAIDRTVNYVCNSNKEGDFNVGTLVELDSQVSEDYTVESDVKNMKPSLAGRISKFLKKHCKKTKTLADTGFYLQPSDATTTHKPSKT